MILEGTRSLFTNNYETFNKLNPEFLETFFKLHVFNRLQGQDKRYYEVKSGNT